MECQLEKTTIFYDSFGQGRPILMLHGRPSDHRHMVTDFEPLFEDRPGWLRLYPDMPGMGKTPGEEWITGEDSMLQVLLDFIEAMIPGQRFAVAGTSYGGYMAQGLVYHRAAMIDGLFLMTPGIIRAEEDDVLFSGLEPDEAEFFSGFAVVQSRELLHSLRTDIFPAMEIADHEFLKRISASEGYSFDIENLPKPFEKPTLILLGRQDSITGYADAWKILDNYPRASFVVLDRAGHGLGHEQKELSETLANEWLDRVSEGIDGTEN
jgi:pimeloyl-ACP methyl ester carboxylesterase